jgi:putative ABC transport system permease protein
VAAIGAEVALAMLQTKVFDFPGRRTGAVGDAAADGAVLLSLCGGGLGLRLLKEKRCSVSLASKNIAF